MLPFGTDRRGTQVRRNWAQEGQCCYYCGVGRLPWLFEEWIVTADHCGQGIASQLLNAVSTWATAVALHVWEGNEITFYNKCGFVNKRMLMTLSLSD